LERPESQMLAGGSQEDIWRIEAQPSIDGRWRPVPTLLND
jgi:hypothetical protein